MIPPLHLITNDEILASPGFLDRAEAVIDAGARRLVLHLRSRGTPARIVLRLAEELHRSLGPAGGRLSLNDRLDIALTVGARWVHVGSASIPARAARVLLGADATLGASVHTSAEVETLTPDVDYFIAGHVYETRTHPGIPARGLALIRSVREAMQGSRAPAAGDPTPNPSSGGLIAIGGITPARVLEVREAGADGVAILSGVWDSGDPGEAVRCYLQALTEAGMPTRLPFTRTDAQAT